LRSDIIYRVTMTSLTARKIMRIVLSMDSELKYNNTGRPPPDIGTVCKAVPGLIIELVTVHLTRL